MKILILNGSPRGARSNTLRLATAFADGFPDGTELETLHLSDLNIKPCLGCFSCWTKTAGRCVISDDMKTVRRAIELADVIIESFPLYFFGMPTAIKTMTDRCLPFMKTYLGTSDEDGKSSFHQLRDERMREKKLVLISTCGYVQAQPMYPALLKQYDLICGEGNYTAILCPQGELFGYDGLAERQKNAYLADVRTAGAQFAKLGKIPAETAERLKKPVLSAGGFQVVVNNHWGSGDGL